MLEIYCKPPWVLLVSVVRNEVRAAHGDRREEQPQPWMWGAPRSATLQAGQPRANTHYVTYNSGRVGHAERDRRRVGWRSVCVQREYRVRRQFQHQQSFGPASNVGKMLPVKYNDPPTGPCAEFIELRRDCCCPNEVLNVATCELPTHYGVCMQRRPLVGKIQLHCVTLCDWAVVHCSRSSHCCPLLALLVWHTDAASWLLARIDDGSVAPHACAYT